MKRRFAFLAIGLVSFISSLKLSAASGFCDGRDQVNNVEAKNAFEWLNRCHKDVLVRWFDLANPTNTLDDDGKVEALSKVWLYDASGELKEAALYPSFKGADGSGPEWVPPLEEKGICEELPENYVLFAACTAGEKTAQEANGVNGNETSDDTNGYESSLNPYEFDKDHIYEAEDWAKSDQLGPSQCNYQDAVVGYTIQGDWAKEHKVYCSDQVKLGSAFLYTDWFTSDDASMNSQAYCPEGWVVDRVHCSGKHCSHLQLGCRPLDKASYGESAGLYDCKEERSMSDLYEGWRRVEFFDELRVLVGLRCKDKHCDTVFPMTCRLPRKL